MSEKKRRRKSSHHATAFETLSGQLTARSHILNTDPEIVILEVCTIDRSEYILFRKANFALLNHPLIIGQHYNFSKLHSSALKIKSNAVRCFRATDETSWEESNAAAEVYHPPSYNDFTNIEGRVTKIDNNFGILYLKSIPVIISTCSLVAKIPMPKLNQKIHIFNVHRYNDENGQVIYAMCVKSYLRISDESAETPGVCCFVKKSPVLSSLGSDALRGFKFILWLQNCHSKVIRNLDEDFLLFFKVPRSEFLKFYASLVKNIALFLIKKSNIQKKSLVEEFLMADHNSYCGILTEDLVPHSLLNISEIDKETPHLDEVEDESGKRLFWQFNVNLKKDLKRILIGVISVKSASHRLTINDSSGSLYCLMMPEQKDDLTLIDVAAFNRKVVLFTDYSVIRERFTWTDRDQLCSQKYNCLAVCSDKVTVVSSLANDQRSSSDKEPPERHTDKIVDKEKYCISLFKSTTFQQFLSQHILVQHKSMVSVPEQGKPARAYLQVLVYGEMTSNTPSPPSSQKNVFPTFISLIGPMLIAHPVIAVNAVYEIRFPIGFDVDFFRKGSPLMCVQSLRGVLPTINCVTLPSCCEIYTVADNPIPTAVMKCRDCYRITECLENVSTRELIDVMGYVTGRYHQDPLYEREKFSVKANGFGTPGCKVMAIILRDTPPESQFGAPITLYLSYWASLQYPLGLLPGSKVIFRFVSRVTSKDGSVYLRSSILSSLEVLKTPNSGQNREIGDPWGPRSALNLIFDEGSNCCHWLTVSMIQLHRVTFTATCSTCSHDYQNGCCTFAGCAVSAAPQIFAQVSFLIEDFKSSSALVFVPNSLISKFFSGSENLLDNISQMTKRYGQMSYYRYLSYEDIAELSIEQRVFRLLCKSYRSRDRFHLLCRKFNKKNDFPHQSDLQVLYAVDINPVSSLMAVS